MQIKRFAKCATLEHLERALNSIPEDLESSYQQTFESIEPDNRKYVKQIMMWLAMSFEPLKVEQVAAIVGFRASYFVVKICTTLLVTIIDEYTTQVIKLAHFSVKEFLIVKLSGEISMQWYRFSAELANRNIAFTALEALLKPDSTLKAIFRYAARYWPQHAAQTSNEKQDPRLEEQISRIFDSDHKAEFSGWLETHDPDNEYYFNGIQRAEPLYYAALLGFEKVVHILWVNDFQLLKDQGVQGNALNAAAVRGHYDIVRWILQNSQAPARFIDLAMVTGRIQVNAAKTFAEIYKGIHKKGGHFRLTENVVKAAVQNLVNGREILGVLLDKCNQVHITEGAVNVIAEHFTATEMGMLFEKWGNEIHITESVVQAAAKNSGSGQQVMELLFHEWGDEIQITEGVVQAAAKNGKSGQQVMKLLIKKRGNQAHITVSIAILIARWFDVTVMELFFEKGGDRVCVTEDVVQAAAENEESGRQVMELLLKKKGNQVHITADVVKAAVGNEKSGREVIELLLEKRRSQLCITEDVVKAAAGNNNSGRQMMELLLKASGNQVKMNKYTASLIAGSFGIVVTMPLLGKRDQVSITDGMAMAAVDHEGLQLMESFLETGTYWFDAYNDGLTPLNIASSDGYVELVMLLLEMGTDLDIADKDGWTPLNNASTNGHIETAALLLQKGASWAITDHNGWTPLNAASTNGHVEIVKLLLDYGADWRIANCEGWTPLHTASLNGHVEVVRLLVDQGADLNTENEEGWTPLNASSTQGHIEVVKLLLERGADWMIADKNDCTPLNAALDEGHIEVAQLLEVADLTVAKKEGRLTAEDRPRQLNDMQVCISKKRTRGHHNESVRKRRCVYRRS